MHYDSDMAVTDGSSIDSNTAEIVSSPAFALASGLVVGSPSDQSKLGENAALARVSARSTEEASTCIVIQRCL